MSSPVPQESHVPIVLAAFGTTIPEATNVYRNIESAVKGRFPTSEIRQAVTSSLVRRVLASRGENAASPEQVIQQLRDEGHRVVVLQSQHVMPGEEFDRLTTLEIEGIELVVGRPLLDAPTDIDRFLNILSGELNPQSPNVLVMHGNSKAAFNQPTVELADRVRRRFPQCVVASLEGEPGQRAFDDVKTAAERTGGLHLLPLLFVAGDHLTNDLMGDGPDSWKSRLEGIAVTCGRPLGEIPAVIELLLDHLADAVRAATKLRTRSTD